jgi:hypothetical protein
MVGMEECKDRPVMLFLLRGRSNAKGRLAVDCSAGCSMSAAGSRASVYMVVNSRLMEVTIVGYRPDRHLLCCAFASWRVGPDGGQGSEGGFRGHAQYILSRRVPSVMAMFGGG